MEPLTPNTSAFLSYLSSGIDTSAISTDQYLSSKDNMNPSSLPPSAFFPMPVPGRDTPEITPPSSNEADQNSPVKHSTFDSGLPSDDSEEDAGRNRKSGGSRRKSEVNHKRKAGSGTQRNNHDDDEDDDEEGECGFKRAIYIISS
jgi:AP-1-like factor